MVGEASLRVEAWANVTDGNNETGLLIFLVWYCPQCIGEGWKSGFWPMMLKGIHRKKI